MNALLRPLLRLWPFVALIASAAMLAIAHAFETFGHLPPCTLCLRQREVYWVALSVAAAGSVLSLTPLRGRLFSVLCVILGVIFLYGAGIAVWHAGAEWGFWDGPKTCASGGGALAVNAEDVMRAMNGGRLEEPHCDKAAWVFLGLSMAGWNALISFGLAFLSAWAARRGTRAL